MAAIYLDEYINFENVLLEPQFCPIGESEFDQPLLHSKFGTHYLDTPLVTISSGEEGTQGEINIIERIRDCDAACLKIESLKKAGGIVIPTIDPGAPFRDDALRYEQAGADGICVQATTGDSRLMVETIRWLSCYSSFQTVAAGNIATPTGALRLVEAGANVIKIGVGTEVQANTGHGMPHLASILTIYDKLHKNDKVTLISEGGVSSSGDVVKALAAGADAVVIRLRNKSVIFDEKGSSMPIEQLLENIRLGMSYSGARTLSQLKNEAVFIKVSPNTVAVNVKKLD